MAGDRDAVLLETVKTHRGRLVASMLFGELDRRRVVGGNVRRFVVGLVLAAVACAGCAGTSFVISVLADQEAQRQAQQAPSPYASPVIPSSATPTPVDPAGTPPAGSTG